MWNVKMDRQGIVCGKMTAFCEAEQQHEERDFMSYMLDDIKRFFPALSTK